MVTTSELLCLEIALRRFCIHVYGDCKLDVDDVDKRFYYSGIVAGSDVSITMMGVIGWYEQRE